MSQGFAREARLGIDLHVGETLYYAADGTFAKADYDGLYGVRVQVQAAGGAGGGVAGGSDNAAGGGGGGGYAEAIVLAADLGTSETVTVGVGGTGVSGADGNGGEDSSFGTHVVATGGSGGQTGKIRGEHGVGSTGDLLRDGGTGGPGIAYGGAFFEQLGGWGGDAALGGVTTVASAPSPNSSLAGISGGQYGGGGSGASSRGASSGAAAGGDGHDGIVIVEVLYERKIAVDEDIHTQYLNDTRHNAAHAAAVFSLSAQQTLSNDTLTTIIFDTVDAEDDEDGDLSLNTSTGVVTINNAGWYLLTCSMNYDGDADGWRAGQLRHNAAFVGFQRVNAISATTATQLSASGMILAAASDTVHLEGRHTAGNNLDLLTTGTKFAIVKLREA